MSVSMLNSQSDERSDQHTHILRQSLLDNSAATAGTTTAGPVLSPLPVPSLLCRSPPPNSEVLPLVWPLQPASSAQASTAVLHLSD